jgi:hypothetical protein
MAAVRTKFRKRKCLDGYSCGGVEPLPTALMNAFDTKMTQLMNDVMTGRAVMFHVCSWSKNR